MSIRSIVPSIILLLAHVGDGKKHSVGFISSLSSMHAKFHRPNFLPKRYLSSHFLHQEYDLAQSLKYNFSSSYRKKYAVLNRQFSLLHMTDGDTNLSELTENLSTAESKNGLEISDANTVVTESTSKKENKASTSSISSANGTDASSEKEYLVKEPVFPDEKCQALEESEIDVFNDEDVSVSKDDLIPSSPALSFGKFLTMQQEKRVVVTIKFSHNLLSYFLTATKQIKDSFPDVLIEKNMLPPPDGPGRDEEVDVFEILIDKKAIVRKGREKKQRELSVFVSMEELETAISKARKRRRPTTLYTAAKSSKDAAMRLEMLRMIEEQKERSGNHTT